LTFPLRWWSIGPFWRYEQPQRGRTREFYQWNIDLIGTEAVAADVEIVAVAAKFLQEVGLSADQVRITVNNRRLMDQVFSRLSINRELRPSVFRLVDKLEKLSIQTWRNQAIETGLSNDQVDGLLKQLENESLWYDSPELIEFFELINTFGVQDYVVFDPKLVRGLDYYTGTVFEAFEIGGQSRAILGGGRYDNLVADVGGKPLPGVGFAMGDVVIELVLRDAGVIPDGLGDTVQILVTVFDSETVPESLRLATEIRQAGFRAVVYPDADKLGKQFKFADKRDIPIAVILGPDEINAGMVAIKNLKTREQVTVAREILLEQIEKFLPCHS
jgi:histidyl-tRNA synthetase